MLPGDRLSIKPLTEADLDAALAIYRQCEDFLALGPQPTASAEMVRSDLDHSRAAGGRFCAIRDVTGTMVGVVDFIPAGFEGDPRCAFISLLMIAAPFRSRGIGRCVVSEVEAHILRNPKISTIRSAVQTNNPAALRFWQRCGYRIAGNPQRQPDQTTTVPLQKDVPARPCLRQPSSERSLTATAPPSCHHALPRPPSLQVCPAVTHRLLLPEP